MRADGEALSPDSLPEAVSRFKRYLNGENDGQDEIESVARPVAPAYVLTMNVFKNQTFAKIAGLDALLFRLFANESISAHHPIATNPDELEAQALLLLRARWRIGWFPSPAGSEVASWPDTAERIKAHLKRQDGDWFDGQNVCIKPPGREWPLALNKVRLLLTARLEPVEAIRRAFSLGQGWISLVCPETGEMRDLSMRALDYRHLRLGARWKNPCVFDAAYALHACPLCNGKGSIESVDQSLIFRDKSQSLDSDGLFQPHALEVLKLPRRQDMLPAARRLKASALIDLTLPLNGMEPAVADAFWFGYPYKAFLKTDGDKNSVGDWHRWQGINKSVLINMWKCSSRKWAEDIDASRVEVSCPECERSGLGWEARQRVMDNVSMQEIYLHYTGDGLLALLKNARLTTDRSHKIKQELIAVLGRTAQETHCDFRLFDRLEHLPERVQQVALGMYLSNHALNHATIYLEKSSEQADRQLQNMLSNSVAADLMSFAIS